MAGKFLSPLRVEQVDGNYWRLLEPLIYNVDNKKDIITVPAGFVTDFASVPIVANWIIPKSGKYNPAAGVHDLLYFLKDRPRKECDGIFCEAMKACSVDFAEGQLMYFNLRAFGWVSWNFGKDKYNQEFKGYSSHAPQEPPPAVSDTPAPTAIGG